MKRIRASMLLLCALGAGPSLCYAVIQEAMPDVHRQSLVEMEPGELTRAVDAAPPLRLHITQPLELPPDSPGPHCAPAESDHDAPSIAAFLTNDDLFADGTWVDKRVLQAMSPADSVVKIRKWWDRRPDSKKKKQALAANSPAKIPKKR